MLFNVCSDITVEFLFCTRVSWLCLLLYQEECSCPVYLQLLRGRIWANMSALVYVFVEVLDGDYVSQLPYVSYYVVIKNNFEHARRECESKCFKCLMVRLILFYKIINGLAQVPFEGVLVEAYKGTRRKHNMKFLDHTTSQYGQSFFPKPISAWNGLAFTEAPSLAVFR